MDKRSRKITNSSQESKHQLRGNNSFNKQSTILKCLENQDIKYFSKFIKKVRKEDSKSKILKH